jgi:hypothetical protein
MKHIASFILFVVLTNNSFASEFKQRTVFACSIEGTLGIFETKPGEFAYIESTGFFGGGVGQVPATLSTENKNGECVVSAEITLPGGKKETKKFNFSSTKDPYTGSTDTLGGIKCNLSKRYKESLAKCKVPTATEPGNKCYGTKSPPLPITLEGATFDLPESKLDLNQGGLAIATYAGISEPYYFKIKIKDGKWCIKKTEYSTDYNDDCESFPSNNSVELRNKDGFIVGVVTASNNDTLIVKQVKKPYSKNNYQVDKDKSGLRIKANDDNTEATKIDLNTGVTNGGATIEGDRAAIDFDWSNNPVKFNVASGKLIHSDCNGPAEIIKDRGDTTSKNPDVK